MPNVGGRPRVLTADQIEQATMLRTVLGLSIAAIAEEVGVNRETLREQFVRDGVQPPPTPPKSDAPPATPTFTPAPFDDAPVDDAGFPATITEAFGSDPRPLPRVADLKDGWATDLAVAEVLGTRSDNPRLVRQMTEADHRKFDSLVDEAYPSNRRDLNG